MAPGTDFDSFMGTVQKIGAQPILIANYGTGTPQEAAGWVQYANITKGYGVKYWEIGNEVYGNGYYRTWSENGQAVTVTNLSWDGTLAADGGNTVNIGFAGANDGAYPSPAAFSLNGTVCATTYSS